MPRFRLALFCVSGLSMLLGSPGVAQEATRAVSNLSDASRQTIQALKPLPSPSSGADSGETLRLGSGDSSHPLQRAMAMAQEHLDYIQQHVRDYRCQLVKQERLEGKLRPHELIDVKCRSRRVQDGEMLVPLSLYMVWTSPNDLTGREVLFIENENRGDLLVRKGGTRNAFLNLWVEPNSSMAMRDNRYPITEFGFENMLVRLLQVGQEELQYSDCKVKYLDGVRIENRPAFGIEVRHESYRDYFRFHIARIFIDRELRVPVHFESWDWPATAQSEPILLERYRYRDIELNVGLEDQDFDRLNPAYGFRKD